MSYLYIIPLLLLLALLLACKPAEKKFQSSAIQNINVTEAKELIESNEELVIIDVRTPEETSVGMIEGAIEFDVKSDQFKSQIETLDKDQTYLVYCRSGKRSTKAVKIMDSLQFKHLINMKGGYLDWEDSNQ